MVFIVICDNPEDQPTILGPFESAVDAQNWINDIGRNPVEGDCPNDHYWSEVIEPIRTPDSPFDAPKDEETLEELDKRVGHDDIPYGYNCPGCGVTHSALWDNPEGIARPKTNG